ncbi:MAG: DUF6463 family protein [Burkholderiales bacterium]|nr:DUF6463 family protein [Burkholderiales bacterium]
MKVKKGKMKMKHAWKISGWYLFVVGIIHNVVGVLVLQEVLRDIWNAGLINSVSDQMDRNAAFWFLFTGFLFIYFGLQWQEHIRRYQEPLSKFSAWGLTAIVVSGLIIMPVSGFWIVLPLCFIMLYPHYSKAASA